MERNEQIMRVIIMASITVKTSLRCWDIDVWSDSTHDINNTANEKAPFLPKLLIPIRIIHFEISNNGTCCCRGDRKAREKLVRIVLRRWRTFPKPCDGWTNQLCLTTCSVLFSKYPSKRGPIQVLTVLADLQNETWYASRAHFSSLRDHWSLSFF